MQFRMDTFLIRKTEVKNQPDCTEMAWTSFARFTNRDEQSAQKEGSRVNQRKQNNMRME
jgi:hypothetical protein